MEKHMDVSATKENYLEAIYKLIQDKGVARVRDIAKALGVAVSTVSGALRVLSSEGFVNYQPYELITLTSAGSKIARRTDRRHKLISRFFTEILDVSPATARNDACRLEHGISPETVERLSKFMEFIDICPHAGERLVKGFHNYYSTKGKCLRPCNCSECLEESSKEVQSRKRHSEKKT